MMEENVVSKAGAPTANKWSMSPEELEMHIRQAGFTPAQRDSAFTIVRRANAGEGLQRASQLAAIQEPVAQPS
jgi:2-iminoacetate synthase ThiH